MHDLALCAVDVDGARAAVARVAADVRAGQAEVVAQEVDEQEARLDVGLVRLAVDGDRDVLGASSFGLSYAYARARSVARAERPDGHLGGHRPLVVDGSADVGGGPALRAGGRAGLRGTAPPTAALPTRIGLGVGRRERRVGDAR